LLRAPRSESVREAARTRARALEHAYWQALDTAINDRDASNDYKPE
jgi:hypothetical protein